MKSIHEVMSALELLRIHTRISSDELDDQEADGEIDTHDRVLIDRQNQDMEAAIHALEWVLGIDHDHVDVFGMQDIFREVEPGYSSTTKLLLLAGHRHFTLGSVAPNWCILNATADVPLGQGVAVVEVDGHEHRRSVTITSQTGTQVFFEPQS